MRVEKAQKHFEEMINLRRRLFETVRKRWIVRKYREWRRAKCHA